MIQTVLTGSLHRTSTFTPLQRLLHLLDIRHACSCFALFIGSPVRLLRWIVLNSQTDEKPAKASKPAKESKEKSNSAAAAAPEEGEHFDTQHTVFVAQGS